MGDRQAVASFAPSFASCVGHLQGICSTPMEILMDEFLGLPINQVNAHVSDELVMRVGIPHTGGRLAFHAFNEGYPAMVSAQAFWNPKANAFKVPEATDLSELDFALDSAGFTAMKLWQGRGVQPGMAGVYPWTMAQYVELACLLSPSWYSQPDFCVEPEIATSQEEIDYRINATATLLEGMLRLVYHWQNEAAKECSAGAVANLIRLPTPVIQGWSASDYERSLELTLQVWDRWKGWALPPALIGVGSVCRRTVSHPTYGLKAILASLERMLPKETKLHLFGVKGTALNDIKMMPFVASADSMAYDFGARINARKAGISNNFANRTREMSAWMSAAAKRMKPTAGDQFRLPLFAA
jgi:hypothetical protein